MEENVTEKLQNDTTNKFSFKSILANIKKYKKEHKVKFYTILLVTIVLISIIITASVCGHREKLYKDLLYEMQYFDNQSVDKIDSILKRLPNDYKNVSEISSEYSLINRHAKKISNIWWSISSGYFMEGSSDEIRETYVQLTLFSYSYDNWNLDYFLDSIQIDVLIFDTIWESSLYFFKWTYGESTQDLQLISTIPNDKDSAKEYCFTIKVEQDYVIFGYENINDPNDYFKSFKVSNFRYKDSKFYVDVYCYKGNLKLVFTADA